MFTPKEAEDKIESGLPGYQNITNQDNARPLDQGPFA